MSLYVRVLNSFYTHRKTIRLRAAIGDAAYWVPPRIWSYASENQPDGCLQQYTPQELAMLIAYQGDGKALLGALLQAGFLDADPIRIHDWEEHNGYHATYAERAKKAAMARWAKPSPTPPLTVPEKTVPDPSNASSIEPVAVLLGVLGDMFGRTRGQLPTYVEQTDAVTVVHRPGWEKEMDTIRAWYNAFPSDRRQYRPQSVSSLLGDWQKNLDRANSNKPAPVKRFGVRGIL